MAEEHSPAAVPLEAKSVECVAEKIHVDSEGKKGGRKEHSPFRVLGLQKAKIGLPLVADHLPAREAPNRNDHGFKIEKKANTNSTFERRTKFVLLFTNFTRCVESNSKSSSILTIS